MIAFTSDVSAAALAAYDDIVDVRSPAEFAEDHLPGAISLPVLSDEERSDVGTIYVQRSRFLARRLGAAMVARNIARHLEGPLSDRPGSWAPLVYCWRGGQRSNAMAAVLDQVGWRVTVLNGGYRTWRRQVTSALYDAKAGLRVILLDGNTGVAKTAILARLASRGVQTLDLEGLACHRGSLFGALPDRPQPSQKTFESALLDRLQRLDPSRPVVIEAESSKVGELNVPPVLWKAMQTAPRIEIAAPREVRADYLVRAYQDIIADPASLDAILARLPVHIGKEAQARWRDLAAAGDHRGLAASLMETHYDPSYERSRRKDLRPLMHHIHLETLDERGLDAAADRIARRIEEAALDPAALAAPGLTVL